MEHMMSMQDETPAHIIKLKGCKNLHGLISLLIGTNAYTLNPIGVMYSDHKEDCFDFFLEQGGWRSG